MIDPIILAKVKIYVTFHDAARSTDPSFDNEKSFLSVLHLFHTQMESSRYRF